MTGRTRLLAYYYIAFCGVCLAAGAAINVGLVLSTDPSRGRALELLGPLYIALSVLYFVPGLLGGLGLLHGKKWARTIIIVLSLLVILLIPVGTAIGGLGLWVLLGPDAKHYAPRSEAPRVEQSAPADGAAKAPRVRVSPAEKSRVTGLLVAMVGVGAAFIIAIGTGFRLTHTTGSPIADPLYYTAIGVLVLVAVVAVKSGWLSSLRLRPAVPLRPHGYVYDPDGLAEQRRQADEARAARLAHLDADPVRRRYADRIRRGQWWSDEMIEYDLHPDSLATCSHLQPIERDMRAAGIDVRLRYGTIVHAYCCVDPLALAAHYTLPSFVRYAEPTSGNRSYEDSPGAVVYCTEDKSQIDAVHKYVADRDTPWFPIDGRAHATAPNEP
jgi:hypothetical protein